MGTKTKELQTSIIEQIERLGWSVKRLARELYYHHNDVDDDDEVLKAEERLKKQLSRATTSAKKLDEILNTIPELDLFKKTNLVSPRYIASDVLSEDFRRAMKELSTSLTDSLEIDV
ncbi:hypothetical protein EKO29_09680 [Colwellia sp. Arc7-635]|jgi:hypothetical protein|uniref:hypothetical protein n=1 Tax=Colwellia sp. Arc7-635 TaxID=2497879 RepID=UPI000F858744|nr:hypothetical protein [Colwellia sp. Arc7-635]AZQ84266.1 hypothetical protein EKO29_09680 [Colwellia sp. Arc7-635]